MCNLVIAILFASSFAVAGETTTALWTDFVNAKTAGTEPTLPDFSYAGYKFSESPIPDVSSWTRFDVTKYGATPDDDQYDDSAIQKAIDAAEANPEGGVVVFPPGRYLISGDEKSRQTINVARS